jgi:hypothetical protein
MRVLALLIVTVLFASSAAQAGPLTLSNLSGGWNAGSVDADGTTSATVDVSNVGGSSADLIEWGTGVDDAALQSGYVFDPFNGGFDPVLNLPFLMGTFTTLNNTIQSITANFYGVDYDFSFDTNGVPAQLTDVLSFTHNETLNVGPCPSGVPPCPDIVSVTVLKLSSMLITVGADTYIFELLGFSTNGGFDFSDRFVSPEGGSSSAGLYAMVTAGDPDVPEIPEPASLGLLGAGLALIAHSVRRRQSRR